MNARRTRVSVRGALVLATAIAALALVSTAPADAHGKKNHRRPHNSVVAVHHRGPAHFVVPHNLVRRDYSVYRPFYAGSFYDYAHRHAHSVYRFPVVTNVGVVHRPFVYCGDHVVVGASIPSGAFVNLGWSDGRGGIAVGFAFDSPQHDHHRDDGHWRYPD